MHPADASRVLIAKPLHGRRRPPPSKNTLVVLDFDGFLLNSYQLLKVTFEHFGLDVGDEDRFRHRRKFLKYLGGGKEFMRNFVRASLPKKKKIREKLTDEYLDNGRIFPEFVPIMNDLIASPTAHVGIVSRNFTYTPGLTIRAVLRNSGVEEQDLDFVIPIPAGVKKGDVLEAMKSSRYRLCLFGADEIGDYRAAVETGYDALMASYGFDSRKRLLEEAKVPEDRIFDSPRMLVEDLRRRLAEKPMTLKSTSRL
jgi:phosphoglycolate phosphatase